ncbi:MAG: hypothetical protein K2M91_00200 [Lachnospiraceae bacterium]|nr:hypothetical protein [Lachnospiraceae bacterium]
MIKNLYRKWTAWTVMMLSLCLMFTACGKQTDLEIDAETSTESIEAVETVETDISKMTENMDDTLSFSSEIATEAETEQESTDVITVYTTKEITYSDEEIPVQYSKDLTLLDHMGQADSSYAYRDGKVYYRQYHKDSFEEGALYATYQPVAGTDKEIVCIDADGEKTVLFSDKGYGDIYLIGERFYMTEMTEDGRVIYSVDMQGQNRIDYGCGTIYAVDVDRGALVVRTQLDLYSVLDCKSGEMIPLDIDGYAYLSFWAYHDGWCYFEAYQEMSDNISRVVAVSLEGEQREIIALADTYYNEYICRMKVVRDRIYLVFGSYAGSGNFFHGGRLITIKLDGSDYRAVEITAHGENTSDAFCVCYDEDRPYVYFFHYYLKGDKDYYTGVWDVEANTVFLSDFPQDLIWAQQSEGPYKENMNARPYCVLKGEETNVYALPDDSSRIVQVVTQIDSNIIQRGDGDADRIDYKHLYYADGFLYFQVEFNVYSEEDSIGWRDGYIRLQTDVYRMKLDGNLLELLYSF